MTLPPESEIAAFAIRAHRDQRYGDKPYVAHLIEVVENLRRFGVDTPQRIAAAWLHDTVEDTQVELSEVRSLFGEDVAAMVSAVTSSPAETRKASNLLTYPRIASTPGAVQVKLADRIANVEACWRTQNRRLFMYHREYDGFRSGLRRDGEADTLWAHLDLLLGRRR